MFEAYTTMLHSRADISPHRLANAIGGYYHDPSAEKAFRERVTWPFGSVRRMTDDETAKLLSPLKRSINRERSLPVDVRLGRCQRTVFGTLLVGGCDQSTSTRCPERLFARVCTVGERKSPIYLATWPRRLTPFRPTRPMNTWLRPWPGILCGFAFLDPRDMIGVTLVQLLAADGLSHLAVELGLSGASTPRACDK